MNPVFISERNGGAVLNCHIQPKASKTKICGLHGNSLKIAVAAPPEDGKANKELCEFLSKLLSIPKSSVSIISGDKSRKKLVFCGGVSKEAILQKTSFNLIA